MLNLKKLINSLLYSKKVCHYPADFLLLSQLGQHFSPYRPTFSKDVEYINENHRYYSICPTQGGLIQINIQGFLRPADALKLYELAYHSQGNILEMGSAWGLSTSILCQAVADSRRSQHVVSLEIDPQFHQQTQAQLNQRQLAQHCQTYLCDALEFCSTLIQDKQQFGFAFIDHCHSYKATCVTCQQLFQLIRPGGFVLFHDFNDERNRTHFPEFGVYQGVTENFTDHTFIFSGLFGCAALYRKSF